MTGDQTSGAPSPAVAPPPGHPRFPLLDGVRGWALVAIVSTHAGGYTLAYSYPDTGPYIAHLATALIVFFSLSGFLMYRPFLAARRLGAPPITIGAYGRRRFLRIVPAYWVALTLLTIYPGLWAVGDQPWLYYGYLQGLPVDQGAECSTGCGIPQAWSLGVEAFFYLSLPFFALLVARITRGASRRRWLLTEVSVIGGLGLASLLLPVIWPDEPWVGRSTLAGGFVWITGGMLLAVASVAMHGREDRSRVLRWVAAYPWAPLVLAVAVYVFICSGLGIDPEPVFVGDTALKTIVLQFCMVSFAALVLLPAIFSDAPGRIVSFLFGNRVIVWLGVISYGGYLWHLTLMNELNYHGAPDLFGSHEFITFTLVSLIFTCAFGAASYYLVERPFLRLKNRRLSELAPIRAVRVRLAGARG